MKSNKKFINQITEKKNTYSTHIKPNITDIQAYFTAISNHNKHAQKEYRKAIQFNAVAGQKANTCKEVDFFKFDIDHIGLFETIELMNLNEDIKTIFQSVFYSHRNFKSKLEYLKKDIQTAPFFETFINLFNELSEKMTSELYNELKDDKFVKYIDVSHSKQGIHIITQIDKPAIFEHERIFNYYKIVDYFCGKYDIPAQNFEHVITVVKQNNLFYIGDKPFYREQNNIFSNDYNPKQKECIDYMTYALNYNKVRNNFNYEKGKTTDFEKYSFDDVKKILNYENIKTNHRELENVNLFIQEIQINEHIPEILHTSNIITGNRKGWINVTCPNCQGKAGITLSRNSIIFNCFKSSCKTEFNKIFKSKLNNLYKNSKYYKENRDIQQLKTHLNKHLEKYKIEFNHSSNSKKIKIIATRKLKKVIINFQDHLFVQDENFVKTLKLFKLDEYSNLIDKLNRDIIKKYPVSQGTEIYFNRYINDTEQGKQAINEILTSDYNFDIVAKTGTGKTTSLITEGTKHFQTVILALPSIIQVNQVAKSFNAFKVVEGVTRQDILIELDRKTKLFITTYESLFKFFQLRLKNSLLIIDEIHSNIKQATIRDEVFENIYNNLSTFSKTITLTGTPHFSIDRPNFKKVNFKQIENKTNIKNIKIVKSLELDIFINEIINKRDNQTGKKIIFINNKKKLNLIKELLLKYYDDDEIIIASKETKATEQIKNIINNSKIDDKVKILLSTCVISESISILNDDIDTVYFFNENNILDLLQFTARPRQALFDIVLFTSPNPENKTDILPKNYNDEILKAIELSKIRAKKLNELNSLYNIDDDYSSDDKDIKYNKLTNIDDYFVKWDDTESMYKINISSIHYYYLLEFGSYLNKNQGMLKIFLSQNLDVELNNIEIVDNLDIKKLISKQTIKDTQKELNNEIREIELKQIVKIIDNKETFFDFVETHKKQFTKNNNLNLSDLIDAILIKSKKYKFYKTFFDVFNPNLKDFNKKTLLRLYNLKQKAINRDLDLLSFLTMSKSKYQTLINGNTFLKLKDIDPARSTLKGRDILTLDILKKQQFTYKATFDSSNFFILKGKKVLNIKKILKEFNFKFNCNYKTNKIITILKNCFKLKTIKANHANYYYIEKELDHLDIIEMIEANRPKRNEITEKIYYDDENRYNCNIFSKAM